MMELILYAEVFFLQQRKFENIFHIFFLQRIQYSLLLRYTFIKICILQIYMSDRSLTLITRSFHYMDCIIEGRSVVS